MTSEGNKPLIDADETFGSSRYGERLDYTKPVYRDVWACVLFLIQVLIILGISIYFWASEYHNLTDSSDNSDGTSDSIPSFNMGGIIVTLLVCAVAGICFGLFWLFLLKRFAAQIIKAMLFFNLFCWIVVIGMGFYLNSTSDDDSGTFLIVIGIIMFLIFGLYTWCVWGRIPFASALLKISSSITTSYPGTICISFVVILLNIFWYLVWLSSFVAYFIWNQSCTLYPYGEVYPDNNGISLTCYDQNGCRVCTSNSSGIVIFLYLLSFYWGIETWKNISHTTTCGVAATWYFSKDARSPTAPALKRTMTTSFGSVCFGSLIVSFLEACRAMIRMMKGNNALKCIALCLLACIENLMRYFNQYAFAQCAIYGVGYIAGAKATFELFSNQLWKAIINDDLSGMALNCGALLGFIVSAGVGYGVSAAFFSSQSDCFEQSCTVIYIALAVIGGIIGFALCLHILYVVRSAIVCVFVCFAEDPLPLKENHPEEYSWVTGVPTYGDRFVQLEGNAQTNI